MRLNEYIKTTLLYDIFFKIKLNRSKRKWRKKNHHNSTELITLVDQSLIEVGNYSYGLLNVISFATNHKLKIGNFCSIAENVTFLLDVEHYVNHISTFPFKVKIMKTEMTEAFGKGNIIIDDDVWIGYGATIMSGVHIGQGAVIAAGSVVVKDVPPYAIMGGVPANVIKYRFDSEIIESLLKINYNNLSKDIIGKHLEKLYEGLQDCSQLQWLK